MFFVGTCFFDTLADVSGVVIRTNFGHSPPPQVGLCSESQEYCQQGPESVEFGLPTGAFSEAKNCLCLVRIFVAGCDRAAFVGLPWPTCPPFFVRVPSFF